MLLPRRTAARFLVAILLLSTFSPSSAFADTAFSLHAIRYNLTYVASQLASFFSDLADAIASHIPVTSLTASAAAPIPSPIAPPAPAPDFLATTTPETSTPPTTTTASDAPQTTIIQQPVIERIVERTVPAPAASGISEQTLAGRLASLKDDLLLRIAAVASAPIAFSGPAPTTPVSTATFAPSQRIDQLTNTAIHTPTITGGTISGANVSGYLPLSGGTLSGTLSAGTLALSRALTGTDASFSGTLSAGTLNVAGLSSQGALIGPYFTATSTTATSSFAGAVGIGTTSPRKLLEVVGDIIVKNGTSLNISNPETGLPLNNMVNNSFHTILNGQVIGTNGGFGNIAVGGVVTANSGSNNLNLALGYSAAVNNATQGVALGYNTTVSGDYSVAIGAGSMASASNLIAIGTSTHNVTIPGKLGIGTSTPQARFTIDNRKRLSNHLCGEA